MFNNPEVVKDVVQDAQEQPSENTSPDKGIQVSEDDFDKEGQHQMPEDDQIWQDKLEMMVTQEVVANAMNDESRQAFEEEKEILSSSASALQVLRRLGSIFTSVYASKLKHVVSLLEENKFEGDNTPIVIQPPCYSASKDFQDSSDDEEDTRSSYEYLNDLEEEYQARALLAKSKRFFKKGTQRFSSAKATDQTECHKCGKEGHFARDCWSKASVPSYKSPFQQKPLNSSQHKLEIRPTKDFEAKYNKVKAKLALLRLSASAFKAATVKNKGLIAEAYESDEEEVPSYDNEIVEVKVLMALAKENDVVCKEGARNGECMKISMRKVHTLLEMEDNDDRKTYLDYLCIDLNYVEEQRNNLLSKHKDLVHELNACKEHHLVLKQAKLDFLTMHEQIPSQKKIILGVDQLTEDPSSSGQKDLVFVKSLADDIKVSIPGVERPWLSEAKGFILPNHDTSRILPAESQRNTTDPSVVVTDSFATEVEALKGVKINEPSLAPAKGNKSSSASKVNSAPAGKLKSVKIKDDPPLAIVINELNNLKLQFSKNQSSYSRNNQQCDRTDHRTCDHAEYISTMNMIISLEREINLRNPQHAFKGREARGSLTLPQLITMILNGSKETVDAQRHMTGVKSYLHKYEEQPGLKVVFRDDSACVTEGYGSIKWSVFSKQYWTEAVATACYTQNRSTIVKRHLKTPYEIFCHQIFQSDGYLLGYSLVSKAIRFFNTRRYPPDEYLHPYEPSKRYQTNSNDVSFIETYECPEPIVLKTEVSSDQNGQTDQNDQSVQNDEILNDDHSEHSNQPNNEKTIDNLTNTKDIQISEHSSSPREKDMATPAPQDRWSQDKNIELVNIIGNPRVGMLTRAMAKELGAASAHEFARLEAIRIFLAFATYMNFIVYQMDVKSAFLNGKLKEEVYVKQPLGFESNEFPTIENSNGTLNNLGPDLSGKVVNETQYRGMIGSLMYLTASRPDIQFSTCLCVRYQANPKESYLIIVKRIFRYLKAMSSAEAEYVATVGCCSNVLWMKSQLADYDIIYEKVLGKKVQTYFQQRCHHPILFGQCGKDVPVDPKAPKPSLQTEEVPQGKKLGAKSGLKRKQSLKHTSESKTEASKSKTSQSKKETQSSLAKDKIPSHLSPPTLVSASRYDASADSTTEADPGLSAPNDSIPSQQDQTKSTRDGLKTAQSDSGTNEESRADEISKKIKLEDLSDLMKDTISVFFTHDSLQDEPIISQKDEMAQQKEKSKAEVASLKARSSYPYINQRTNLLVAKLKNIQWELPVELQALPVLFATVVENALDAMTKDVPLAGQATASPANGEKNTTKDAETNLQNELVDFWALMWEDETIEVIANLKVSHLQLAEWREVVQACPNRKEKEWKTIYGLLKTRMEYLDQTEKELKIDFNKPLKEQDPLNELNELANKKRKRTSDLKDHSSFGGSWRGWIKGYLVSSTASILVNESPTLEFYFQQGVGGVKYDEDLIIDKVAARLSKWKAKTLSIGGRFTLTKAVLSTIPLYFFSLFKVPIGVLKHLESCRRSFFLGMEPGVWKASWFSWDSLVASKEVRGLGMSSFFAINHALLLKWIWRFKAHPEAMWVSIIKAIYRPCGNLDRDIPVGKSSTWLDYIRSISHLKGRGVDLYLCMKNKVGNGNDSLFWLENWLGKGNLKVKYPRLFDLEENKEVSIHDKVQNVLVEDQDSWLWNLDGEALNKLPKRFNMSLRGLAVLSIECPVSRVVGASGYWYFFVSRLVKLVRWFEVKEGGQRLLGSCVGVITLGMKRGFLSQKGSGIRRGVKEKDLNRNKMNTTSGNSFSSSTGLFSFQFSSMDGLDAMLENGPWFIRNNPLILKKSHPDKNLLKEDVSIVPVWVKFHCVPVTAFSEDGLSAIATKLVVIEIRADVKLKDNIVVAMPKSTREDHYTCNVHVEYEWKPYRCSSCKVFRHIHEECLKNTGASEKKTMKKPSQTSQGVLVGPKMGFKPQKEYRPVPKKSTVSFSGNKKKGVKPTIEVSNSNSFDVLNSVDNDVEFGTNGRTTNLVNNGATSSGSSFMNVDNSSSDKAGNPLKKVEFSGEYDSEDEVASIDNDMDRYMAFERVGFSTQILLEQWRDSYGNGDYDDDTYDDDMYEGPINLGPERPRVYSDLSRMRRNRYNADIRQQTSYFQDALEGDRNITKEDREFTPYDDFEHFVRYKEKPFMTTMCSWVIESTKHSRMLIPGQAMAGGAVNSATLQQGRSHSKDLHSTQCHRTPNTQRQDVRYASQENGVVLGSKSSNVPTGGQEHAIDEDVMSNRF
ncbi:retrovirus-related pol polyprotein from transposon TNT 1-94 [Tanacetum coccineum]|uniref:Retrovirus-related pol polyprotein from transposon TNT 1-94 n=1 Tax=Tanacetum coccineum TaxID=301880 RepID=A0ABQ5DD94_9ASTR